MNDNDVDDDDVRHIFGFAHISMFNRPPQKKISVQFCFFFVDGRSLSKLEFAPDKSLQAEPVKQNKKFFFCRCYQN